MKVSFLALVCSVSAARLVIPTDNDALIAKRGLGFLDKLGIHPDSKIEAIKGAAQAAGSTVGKGVGSAGTHILNEAHKLVDKAKDKFRHEYADLMGSEPIEELGTLVEDNEPPLDFGDAMRTCDIRDCKNRYFMKETFRWMKQALVDMGVYIHDNPTAAAALFIGMSILIANIITPGGLVSVGLRVIGFGSRGPISGSIAALVQKKLGDITAKSVFAQLQSAAMNGASRIQIEKLATMAFAGLTVAGVAGLIGADFKSSGQEKGFELLEWRSWEVESRVNYSSEPESKKVQIWGAPRAQGCVAYGYREYRAPVWFIPDETDPLQVCLQTPATINGVGFRTPLACVDEGPKKGVIATWYVESNETQCMPWWSAFEDEGCVQYGRRRQFARLVGLRQQDDWNGVCESTPALVGDQSYDGPTYCEDKGILGIYGIFDVPDAKCECYCSGAQLA